MCPPLRAHPQDGLSGPDAEPAQRLLPGVHPGVPPAPAAGKEGAEERCPGGSGQRRSGDGSAGEERDSGPRDDGGT